ncbi:hypothetical protein EPUL_003203, partial [Erysiphe pulchra]
MVSDLVSHVGKRCRSIGESNDTDTRKNSTEAESPPRLRRKITDNNGALQRPTEQPKIIRSPFQLTKVRDLPNSLNVDSVSLNDILGDPLLSECWDFNYLHDLDFLVRSFDQDVQHLVKIHVVHGFWKREDPSRLMLEMFILFRHDETAQIIIHTANIIEFDWTNMTQGLWRSPLLAKLSTNTPETSVSGNYGDGSRFKFDLVNYLKAYDLKSRKKICEELIKKLVKYDFSSIRGALIASVPGKHDIDHKSGTLWGWAALQEILKTVTVKDVSSKAEIITQISSIATLGTTNNWLEKTFFKALKTVQDDGEHEVAEPEYKVIFPTVDEIRRSLNGYDSGSAIHTKIHTSAQAKQLQYIKPLLCHWAGDGTSRHDSTSKIKNFDAGRKRAAPHIKTYIRFSDKKKEAIDWMLLTSANLSKQAWGESINASGNQRVCSYEIGVLIWPSAFGTCVKFVPTFQTDEPSTLHCQENYETIVGIRMPYDLPVISYDHDAEP